MSALSAVTDKLASIGVQSVEAQVAVALLVLLLGLVLVTGSSGSDGKISAASPREPYFKSKVRLAGKDQLLLDMLDNEANNFVITDPSLKDNPIVHSSAAFCRFTQYSSNEIVGRNCRFLQGKDTAPADVSAIRKAVVEKTETNVQLLNYKKDGTTFINQFFISPLRDEAGATIYFIGVQHAVRAPGKGQHPENPGWIYTFSSHS